MKNHWRWLGRSGASILFAVILSACNSFRAGQPSSVGDLSSQSSNTPTVGSSTTMVPPSNTVSPSNTVPPSSTPSGKQLYEATQVSPAPTIATFQTQQRTSGFSRDSQHFIHLESWRDTGAGIPHAAVQVMNLPTNACVAKGCLRTQFNESQADQSLAVAENDLLRKTQTLRQDLQLTAPVAGRSLPVLSRAKAKDGTETVTVRLQNQQPLKLTLRQKRGVASTADMAEKDQAAMQLEISYNGKTRSLGSLDKMQDWMVQFSIREVKQSADGKTVAILLTAAERAFEGTLGRTLVQGFEL